MPKEGGHLSRSLRIEKPYQRERPPQGRGSVRVSGAALSSQPSGHQGRQRGPGGVAKGRSREPRDGAARRRRRLVSPGQSSAEVSRPQTPSGATGTAPLAAAKAATGPPPPPPSPSTSASSSSASPRRRTWRDPDLALARSCSPLNARLRKPGSRELAGKRSNPRHRNCASASLCLSGSTPIT
ncbi:uncharacterized protein LOC144578717 [Callithrix jacchus]